MKILDQWTLPDGKFARVIIDEEGDRIYQVSLNGENWLGVPMHDAVGPCLARAFEAMAELRLMVDLLGGTTAKRYYDEAYDYAMKVYDDPEHAPAPDFRCLMNRVPPRPTWQRFLRRALARISMGVNDA